MSNYHQLTHGVDTETFATFADHAAETPGDCRPTTEE